MADHRARTADQSASSRVSPPREPGMADEKAVYLCDLCGNVMLDLHCKLVCERCGYKRDCSDP